MAHGRTATLLEQVRRLAKREAVEASDGELVRRFAACRDEDAFTRLVQRHGSMVLGTCRRVLGSHHDAEDAFQATFLVLARKAGSLRQADAVGPWLYGVASRLALRARARRRAMRATVRPQVAGPVAELTLREALSILDEELSRLPPKYQAPLVLCALEGATRDEAAQRLGCPLATLKSRLERGRALLRRRLVRRGVEAPAGLAALALVGAEAAAVPTALAETTTQAATSFAAGVVASRAAALAVGALRTAPSAHWVRALVLLAALGGGLCLLGRPGPHDEQPPAPSVPDNPAPQKKVERLDQHDDSLPDGALARLGSVRLADMFVNGVAFSPDGKQLAAASYELGLSLWHAANGRQVRDLPRRDQYLCVAYSPDGKLLAAGGRGLDLYDAATGTHLRNLGGSVGVPYFPELAFSPDGKRIASLHKGSVHLWETSTGELVRTIEEPLAGALAWSADGKTIALADLEGGVSFRDPRSGEVRQRLPGRRPEESKLVGPCRVALSSDGRYVAASARDGMITFWDLQKKEEAHLLVFAPPGRSLAFAPRGGPLATGHMDGTVIVWDTNGKELRRWRPHAHAVLGLAFAPDGKVLATGAEMEKGPRLWDAATGKEAVPAGAPYGLIDALAFSPDGKELVTFGREETVHRWDLAGGRGHAVFDRRDHPYTRFALSADGRRIATWEKESDRLDVWDAVTGKAVAALGPRGGSAEDFWPQPPLVFSRDGGLLAAPDKDNAVGVWEVASGKKRLRLDGCRTPVSCVALSADGRSAAAVATSGDKGGFTGHATIHLWDLATGKQRRTIASAEPTRVVAFSPDARLLATTGNHAGAHLWDAATGKRLTTLEGVGASAYVLAFSPDGRFLSASGGNRVVVWEVLSGKMVRSFEHAHGTCAVAFAPDGRALASGGSAMVYLWDLPGRATSGKRPAVLTAEALAACWSDLLSDDAARATRAVWGLADDPARAVPFLRDRLRPAKALDSEQLARLIAGLDADDFAARRRAAAELRRLGEPAMPALRRERDRTTSAEVRRAIGELLENSAAPSADQMRLSRAVQALEHAGTPRARQVLETLAGGAQGVRLTEEARASLRRLAGAYDKMP